MATMSTSSFDRRTLFKAAAVTGAVAGVGMLTGAGASTANADGSTAYGTSEVAKEGETFTVSQTISCDFVVCGGGISGMSAAIDAKEAGLDVVLLEKLDALGGTLFGTEGILGVGSQMQKDAGIEIPEFWSIIEEELDHTNWRTDPLAWSDFIKASGSDIDFLQAHGAVFKGVDDYNGVSTKPDFHWWEDGAGTTSAAGLAQAVVDAGVNVMTGTPLYDLKVVGGAVCGAYAKLPDGGILEIDAPAVLIATGGSTNNFEFLEARTGMTFPDAQSPFELQMNADGIILAAKYGAMEAPICGLNVFTAYGFGAQSPIALVARMEPISLMVNSQGERFVTEEVCLKHRFSIATNVLESQEGKCWTILDQNGVDYLEKGPGNFISTIGFKVGEQLVGLSEQFDEAVANANPYVLVSDTIEGLAEGIGCDPAALQETVAHYNELSAAGSDPDFGKDPAYLLALETGPFYAVSPIMSFFSTMGGIQVNRGMHVLDKNGQPIEGLFASGVCSCTLYKETYNYAVSGGQNAYCCYSGRRAAQEAAALKA